MRRQARWRPLCRFGSCAQDTVYHGRVRPAGLCVERARGVGQCYQLRAVQRIGFPEHMGDMIASGLRCSMLAVAEHPCAISTRTCLRVPHRRRVYCCLAPLVNW
jgi:hypothetical protein